MTTLNAYASLAEFKSWMNIDSTDAADDVVIENILKAASRTIDSKTGRRFYPIIETRYFDLPLGIRDARLLRVGGELLEIISVTNGDDVVIPSTEYKLQPRNATPYTGVRLNDTSTYYWASDSTGDTHDVIEINGVWGYHNRYSQAWLTGSTAAEDMDASETAFDVTSGTLFAVGNLIRFGNEIGYLSAVVTNTLTTTRGENGSTAATHDTGINVSIWQVMDDIKEACLHIARSEYQKRTGQNTTGNVTVTAAGVVISPQGMPPEAMQILVPYRNIL